MFIFEIMVYVCICMYVCILKINNQIQVLQKATQFISA